MILLNKYRINCVLKMVFCMSAFSLHMNKIQWRFGHELIINNLQLIVNNQPISFHFPFFTPLKWSIEKHLINKSKTIATFVVVITFLMPINSFYIKNLLLCQYKLTSKFISIEMSIIIIGVR